MYQSVNRFKIELICIVTLGTRNAPLIKAQMIASLWRDTLGFMKSVKHSQNSLAILETVYKKVHQNVTYQREYWGILSLKLYFSRWYDGLHINENIWQQFQIHVHSGFVTTVYLNAMYAAVTKLASRSAQSKPSLQRRLLTTLNNVPIFVFGELWVSSTCGLRVEVLVTFPVLSIMTDSGVM